MRDHMNVAGAIITTATRRVLGCTVRLWILLFSYINGNKFFMENRYGSANLCEGMGT